MGLRRLWRRAIRIWWRSDSPARRADGGRDSRVLRCIGIQWSVGPPRRPPQPVVVRTPVTVSPLALTVALARIPLLRRALYRPHTRPVGSYQLGRAVRTERLDRGCRS